MKMERTSSRRPTDSVGWFTVCTTHLANLATGRRGTLK
jgi:hypothetical protein